MTLNDAIRAAHQRLAMLRLLERRADIARCLALVHGLPKVHVQIYRDADPSLTSAWSLHDASVTVSVYVDEKDVDEKGVEHAELSPLAKFDIRWTWRLGIVEETHFCEEMPVEFKAFVRERFG